MDTETAMERYDIINDVNINAISQTIQKISQLQTVIQKNLRQNHDFGVIPGTNKPTLLKPGAEKILMLLGITSEYTTEEKIMDYENGFFAFTVRCTLLKNNCKITEGLGHCNTREKKYIRQDPYTLANTALKMAKKRSQVDATLTVASLSDIFTQDLEDMDLNGNTPQQNNKPQSTQQNGNNNFISGAQAKRMFAISKGNELLVKTIIGKYSYNSSKEVKKSDYEAICKEIEDAAINPPINEDISEEFCNIIDDGFDDKIVGDKPY
jgi:hypothetical protein